MCSIRFCLHLEARRLVVPLVLLPVEVARAALHREHLYGERFSPASRGLFPAEDGTYIQAMFSMMLPGPGYFRLQWPNRSWRLPRSSRLALPCLAHGLSFELSLGGRSDAYFLAGQPRCPANVRSDIKIPVRCP
jgi:hypothetical protein